MPRKKLFIAGIFCVLLLCSCNKAYKNVVPADAVVVGSVDMKALFLKADWENQKKDVLDLLKDNVDEEIYDLIEKMAEDPLNSGFDLLNPAYTFVTLDSREPDGFIAISVSDMEKVKKSLKKIETLELRDSDGMFFLQFDDFVLGVLTNDILLVGSADDRSAYRDMIKQDKGKSYFSTDAGKFFEEKSGDITVQINAEAIPQRYIKELERNIERETQISSDYIDAYKPLLSSKVQLNLTFSTGRMSLNMYVDGMDDYAKSHMAAKKINKEVLDYLPTRDLIGFAAFGLDGKKYWDLSETMINRMLSEYGMNRSERKMINRCGEFLSQVDGTSLIAVNGMNFDDDLEVLGIVPVAKKEFSNLMSDIDQDLPHNIYLYGNADYTALTTSSRYDLAKVPSPFDKPVKSNYLYAYFNPYSVVENIYEEETRYAEKEERNMLNKIFDIFRLADYVELKVPDTDEASLEIVLNDNSKNALALIINKSVNCANAYLEYEKYRKEQWRKRQEEWEQQYSGYYNYYDEPEEVVAVEEYDY
ncbi:MAG: DUF4836 family protein [Paludibacteraceae bacterium]|nr:DUF4836 family protein [Paludibacteraceae bacterium]